MRNRLRLWFSKNGSKLVTTILIIIFVLFLVKKLESISKKEYTETKEIISRETNTNPEYQYYNTAVDEVVDNFSLDEIEKTSAEYTTVSKATNKIINAIYNATINSDNKELKTKICNMLSQEEIMDIHYAEKYNESFDIEEGILEYMLYIDETDDCKIKEIYRYSKNSNMARYIVTIDCRDYNNTNTDEVYMVIDIDSDSNTFEYDGNLIAIDEINDIRDVDHIEANDDNVLE